MALSQRGLYTKEFVSQMLEFVERYVSNAYDKETNPQGVINLGLAENQLCEDLWMKKLNEEDMTKWEPQMQYYTEWRGTEEFRTVVAEFLTERFNSPVPLDPHNITATCGAGAALDLLTYTFTDPGDCFLCVTPMYAVIASDIGIRSKATLHFIHLPGRKSPGQNAFKFNRSILENGLKEAKQKGKKVKGLILINPGNPTGDVYDINLIQEALRFCHEHDLHIIMDEIYALSVWDENCKFRSVLSIEDIPDPNKTHFVWSLSKDMGLSGFRCGIIHTMNTDFYDATRNLCYFGTVPNLIQEKIRKILLDKEWLDRVYFPTNLSRMRETFQHVRNWCDRQGIAVHPATQGAYFLWADFTPYLKGATTEAEKALFEEMFSEGVYIVPGTALFSREVGWFRITFTMRRELLDLGLMRMEEVLKRNGRKSQL